MFREREWRDACGVSAVLKVAANTPVSVDVSGTASCTAVVTLDKDAVAELKANSPLNTETYGPDTTVCALYCTGVSIQAVYVHRIKSS
jgi:hypothetical protein